MRSPFPKVRHRIQRAFLAWYAEHQAEFVRPLQYISRKNSSLFLGIEGLHPAVGIHLTWEVGVTVEWKEVFWDFLISFEAAPKSCADGYYCAMCELDGRTFYPSREDLWQEHLFEPFKNWLNNTLIPANWLGLYGGIGCDASTWVELLIEPDPKATHVLPLWLPSNLIAKDTTMLITR